MKKLVQLYKIIKFYDIFLPSTLKIKYLQVLIIVLKAELLKQKLCMIPIPVIQGPQLNSYGKSKIKRKKTT